jgi:hypothetical protein
MILHVYGDLFSSPALVLVNPVNTSGAMSAGLAQDFKRFYPAMFDAYRAACQSDSFSVGELMLYRTPRKWVLNFPIKRHWRASAKLEIIEQGLQKFVASFAEQGISSASFPLLGAGESEEADWEAQVLPLLHSYLHPLPLLIYVHHLSPAIEQARNPFQLRKWLNNPVQVPSFEQMWRDLVRACKRQGAQLETPQGNYQLTLVEASAKTRLALKLNDASGTSHFIPESALRDWWQLFSQAGYLAPQQFPSGLALLGSALIALALRLPYCQALELQADEGERVLGLQLIPPLVAPS